VGCGLLLEVGWLALWPLSVTLSHSASFTVAMLADHPWVAWVFGWTLSVVRVAMPGLSATPLTEPLGDPTYVAPAAELAGVMVWLGAGYLAALLALERHAAGARTAQLRSTVVSSRPSKSTSTPTVYVVIAFAVLFQATLLWLPGLFSQDVFSYIAYGRIAALYELNPYIWPPSVLRDPVVPWVADVWRTYASPYGPVWVDVQWLLARASNTLSIADQAVVYRLLANLLLLTNLVLVWPLLGRLTPMSPAQRTTALAALAWNPLLLFEIAGNAHNDVLMISFSLLGLLLFRHSSRGLLSSAALCLGALVKYLSGLGLLWLALATAARVDSWAHRAVRLAASLVVAALIAVIVAIPWLELPDSLDPLLTETAGVGFVNSLPDILVSMVADRLGQAIEGPRAAERLLVVAGFAVYLVWEASRVWRDPGRMTVARALARSSALYVLVVSSSMQSWYLCLPVSIAVALGWRQRLSAVILMYGALALPSLYLSYYLRESTPGWVFVVYGAAPLLALALYSTARARAGAHVPPTKGVRDDKQRAHRDGVAGAVMEEAGR
jgi:hypothetical protein